jgi:putative copper export protein
MDDALADGRGGPLAGRYRAADCRFELEDGHPPWDRTPPGGHRVTLHAHGYADGRRPWDGTPAGMRLGGDPADEDDYVGHHYAGRHHDDPPFDDTDEDRLAGPVDDDEIPHLRTPPGGYRAADYRRWEDDDVTIPEPEPVAPEPPPPGAGQAPKPPPAPAAAPALLPPSPPVAAGVAAVFAAGLVAACVVLVALRWPPSPAGGGPLAALDASVNRAVAADRVLSVATWVENVATLLVVGGVCFRLYVSRPAITGRGASEPALVAASLVGIGACVVSVPLRAMVVSGRGLPAAGDLDALGLVATSRFGDAACVRLLALVLFAVTLARPPRGWGRRVFAVGGAGSVVGFLSVSRVTLERVACGVAGLVALASFTFVGHPQASRPRGFLLVSQAVHVTAAAVWFGGGALLAMEIHRRWRHDSPRAMAETIERFSTLAGVSVALVAITGIVLAHSQLASPEALVTSHYGRALIAKLAFVGLVTAVGAYNHSRLVPAIAERRDAVAWRHLGWTTAAEGTLIVVGVLVMTAAMTSGGI